MILNVDMSDITWIQMFCWILIVYYLFIKSRTTGSISSLLELFILFSVRFKARLFDIHGFTNAHFRQIDVFGMMLHQRVVERRHRLKRTGQLDSWTVGQPSCLLFWWSQISGKPPSVPWTSAHSVILVFLTCTFLPAAT